MFNTLKKRLEEEDGEVVSKLSALVTSGALKSRGGHSRQGSASTLSSFTIDGTKDGTEQCTELKLADGRVLSQKDIKKLESKEDEWRKKLQKKDEECSIQMKKVEELWKRKMETLEKEMKKELERKDAENRVLLSEKKNLIKKLDEIVQQNEELKNKLCQYQEDHDQLEGFQTQEMSKIKHLLLQNEQKLSDSLQIIETQKQTINELNGEVKRLLETERKLSDVMNSANTSILTNQTEFEEKLKQFESLEQGNAKLTLELENERTERQKLEGIFDELKAEYESEKHYGELMKVDIGKETREKDELMMRNAEVSQEVELVRKELRCLQQENNEMHGKLDDFHDIILAKEEELKQHQKEKENLSIRIQDLENSQRSYDDGEEVRKRNNILEDQLLEKNKTIKILQQRLNDLKKTMQKELKGPSKSIDPGGMNGEGLIHSHSSALLTPSSSEESTDDVNFKYLKHVLFKFLTCREYEAQHLTRAVATLLRFTAEEERLLRETMDWKTSWFGSRPKINSGFHSQSPS